MYKYLLCWRYLRTRYIALASIISVMLGVATMIVVNSVMAGFSGKMRDRLHGVLADVAVDGTSFKGFDNPDEVIAVIKRVGGDRVVALTPVVETVGLLNIEYRGHTLTRQVSIIGIDPKGRSAVGDFAAFVVGEDGKTKAPDPSFEVTEEIKRRNPAGAILKRIREDDPFNVGKDAFEQEVANSIPPRGAILGWSLGSVHRPGTTDDLVIAPKGAKVVLTFPTADQHPEPVHDDYTVVSFFKSGMSEYDSSHVYVPIERLKYMRGMGDEEGRGAVNQIQIKVREGVDIEKLASALELELERKWGPRYQVQTWEQRQGPLLAAVAIEQNILNILLFFIIAVAGFGILAIFSMIVVEKTRDIGVLKALGASTGGIRGIFLGYGLLLGLVGSGVGMLGGLLFVWKINAIERFLSKLTGQRVFNPDIYYFDGIPTYVSPWTVASIVVGTLVIAVVASVWPAQRAARLHPVKALRFE